MDSFKKLTKVAHILATFSMVKVIQYFLCLGYIMGDLITNSSGHPGCSTIPLVCFERNSFRREFYSSFGQTLGKISEATFFG
jgi:hypothetical protein